MPREWLQYAFGTDVSPVVQYAVAFLLIFALLGGVAVVLRRLHANRTLPESHTGQMGRQPRLGIVDIYEMDAQRRLILLRRDGVEHLLLVGGPNDLVIEQRIERAPAVRAELLPSAPAERAEPAVEAPRPRETRKDPAVPSYGPAAATTETKPAPETPKADAERPVTPPVETPAAKPPAPDKPSAQPRRLDPETLSNVSRELGAVLAPRQEEMPSKEPAKETAAPADGKGKEPPVPERDLAKASAGAATPTAVLEKPLLVSVEPAKPASTDKPKGAEPARPSESKDAAKVLSDPFSMEQIEAEFARLLGQSRSNRG